MKKKLNKIAKDTNFFLRKFISKQKKSDLIVAMKYGLFSGGKKIRSKILMDIGSLFKIDYRTLIIIGAAVECIHAYSLLHEDLPCMDDVSIRSGKPSVLTRLPSLSNWKEPSLVKARSSGAVFNPRPNG